MKQDSWKSLEYRKWIRDNTFCITCEAPLVLEKENYTTHHFAPSGHISTGGKEPSDEFLVSLCLWCHNFYHRNPEEFKRVNEMIDDDFLASAISNLAGYLACLDGGEAVLNLLATVARHHPKS